MSYATVPKRCLSNGQLGVRKSLNDEDKSAEPFREESYKTQALLDEKVYLPTQHRRSILDTAHPSHSSDAKFLQNVVQPAAALLPLTSLSGC